MLIWGQKVVYNIKPLPAGHASYMGTGLSSGCFTFDSVPFLWPGKIEEDGHTPETGKKFLTAGFGPTQLGWLLPFEMKELCNSFK